MFEDITSFYDYIMLLVQRLKIVKVHIPVLCFFKYLTDQHLFLT